MSERHSGYDSFAWFYNRNWGKDFHRQTLGILDRLLFPRLAAGARILDLCCGTGQVTAEIAARGFRVTGLDASGRMLCHARENAPGVEFVLADAREFEFAEPFDAVISVFDSLNHIMSLEELGCVFGNVARSLAPGGWFLFDLNRENAYRYFWTGPWAIVEDDSACVSRGSFDEQSGVARCDLTLFRRESEWRRTDTVLFQKYHPVRGVTQALERAGFERVDLYDSADLGMTGDVACARTFFAGQRPSGRTATSGKASSKRRRR